MGRRRCHEGKGGGERRIRGVGEGEQKEKGGKQKGAVEKRLSIGEKEGSDGDGSEQFVGEGRASRLVSEG